MAPFPQNKLKAGCNSPHDWLMSLAMDLAALCDILTWKWHQWMPFGCFQCGYGLFLPLHGSPQPPTLHPYKSAYGIGYASEKLSKMVGNSATYPFNSWWRERLRIAIESWWIACKCNDALILEHSSLFILHNIVHSSYIRLFTHYYASIVLYSILLADNEFWLPVGSNKPIT